MDELHQLATSSYGITLLMIRMKGHLAMHKISDMSMRVYKVMKKSVVKIFGVIRDTRRSKNVEAVSQQI